MNAATILAIPLTEPERLFSKPGTYKDEFRALAKQWHPDYGGDPVVFDRIVKLHDAAAEKVSKGEWHTPGLLEVDTATKHYRIRYDKKHTTETGELYIARTIVAHAVKTDFADLAHAAEKIMNRFEYASDRMEREVSRYLPTVRASYEAANRRFIVMKKTEDLVLLRDLMEHVGGRVDPKHVAWIISSLLNLACYFEYADIVHNAIGTDTYFISPPLHGGTLLGGWWYACETGGRMTAVPARTSRLAPPDVMVNKRADPRTDLALIRATGRELLGDPVGTKLDCPAPMSRWLRLASTGSARADYAQWQDVLKESFGPRRFTEMKIKAGDIYGKDK